MTSGVPIIVSDLPSIREIATDAMVTFFEADDPKSLAAKIQEVRDQYSHAQEQAGLAQTHVVDYDWKHRARTIKEFIETLG